MSLAVDYERLCSTPSDIVEHLPTFVRLAGTAGHVIELGTRSGVSTVAWLHGLDGHGRLTSVDIDARPDIGEHDHWTFIQGDDLSPDVLAQLDPADVVFIDTSHHYDHTLAELRVYQHLVKPGGVMVLHDTMLARPEGAPARPRFPVRAAVEEFCAEQGYAWSNDERCWGLATISVGDPFSEAWFPEASQRVLATLVRSVAHLSGDIVEVGSWTGRSTCALADAAWPEVVQAVDTWEGSPGEVSADFARWRDVFAEFRRNVARRTRGNVKAHRMGWRDFFAQWGSPVKFVFIDAEHTYDEVRDNLQAVLPLMVPGGVVCGDDIHHPPVAQAVADVLGAHNVQVEATLWVWRVSG